MKRVYFYFEAVADQIDNGALRCTANKTTIYIQKFCIWQLGASKALFLLVVEFPNIY